MGVRRIEASNQEDIAREVREANETHEDFYDANLVMMHDCTGDDNT